MTRVAVTEDQAGQGDPRRVHPTRDADDGLADAQARAILEVLRDGPEANLVLVHRACAVRLPGYPGTEAQQLCAETLHTYRAEDGKTSLDGYRKWLGRQRRPHPYPSDYKIRRAFARPGEDLAPWWHVEEEVFGAPAPYSAALHGVYCGTEARYPADQVAEALDLWLAEELEKLTQVNFWRFCVQAREEGRIRLRWLPSVKHVARMVAKLGGWEQALLDRGVWCRRHLTAAEWRDREADAQPPAPNGGRYDDRDVDRWLHEAAAKLDAGFSEYDYDDWSEDTQRTAARRGELLRIPRSGQIKKRYGTFLRALHLFEIIGDREYLARSMRRSYSDDDLRDCLKSAAGNLDESFRRADWRRWRERESFRRFQAGEDACVPSDATIANRLGWPADRQEALAFAAGASAEHEP